MSYDIIHRYTRAVLYHAVEATTLREAVVAARDVGAYLRGADLRGAYLRGAYLRGADLRGADLRGAYLRGADLQGADLRGADLQGADLRGADLQGAKGIDASRCTPLLMLLDQPGPIRAYKMVDADGRSPIQSTGKLTYTVGERYEVAGADTDVLTQCGAGINVATLDWCLREYQPGWRVLVVEFTANDIAAIPTATDGKFRLKKCRVVGEKDISGLIGTMGVSDAQI
jgi:hypothetical protein